MRVRPGLSLPDEPLRALCARYHVRELAAFGSALRADFREDSDLDLLVAFQPTARIGLIAFLTLREELEKLAGRSVDLVSRAGLKRGVRDEVLQHTRVLYAT